MRAEQQAAGGPDIDPTDIQTIIDEQRAMLRLLDWDVRFDPRPLRRKAGAWAHCRPDKSSRIATMRIAVGVHPEDVPWLVAHELMHLVMYDLQETALPVIAGVGKPLRGVLDVLHDQIERVCSTVAHALTGTTGVVDGDPRVEAEFGPFTRQQEAPSA